MQAAVITELCTANAEQARPIAALRARVVELERRLGREQGHPRAGDVGLLHDVGQHMVPTVAVDDRQPLDPGPPQRLGDITAIRVSALTLTVPANALCSWEHDSVTGGSSSSTRGRRSGGGR